MRVPTHSSLKGCGNAVLLSGTEKRHKEKNWVTSNNSTHGTHIKPQQCNTFHDIKAYNKASLLPLFLFWAAVRGSFDCNKKKTACEKNGTVNCQLLKSINRKQSTRSWVILSFLYLGTTRLFLRTWWFVFHKLERNRIKLLSEYLRLHSVANILICPVTVMDMFTIASPSAIVCIHVCSTGTVTSYCIVDKIESKTKRILILDVKKDYKKHSQWTY